MNSKIIKLNPQDDKWQEIKLTDSLVTTYALEEWSREFNLMTAGYRDQLDPNDIGNPNVVFNLITVSILGEAKARVFERKKKNRDTLHVHLGGETRPHTQDFISVLARIYAAHEFKVHLRAQINTTPIWYSSFGIFYEEFQSGDNLTASHSQFFKGGWKPMDSLGKQLVDEEADIVAEVKNIVKSRATIKFAPWLSSGNILHDFDIDEAYVNYQKSVVNEQSVDEIKKAGKKGFRCAVCTVGGSMKATTERLFKHFDISTGENGIIQYFYDEEDSQYHQIGQIKGENFGVDPTKKQIYTTIGAQDKLLNNEADIVFIWDPDGDRFNMVTMASADRSDQYTDFGLEVEPCPGTDKCIVYFTPNQIFFMLTAFRIVSLKASKIFYTYDWFLASSVTTSRALDELAESENIPVVHVRVGFKHWGTFASWLENRDNETEVYVTALREKIQLGKNPRLIIMCEESGGAVFGGSELLMNKNGTQELIGMREKDGFQFGLLTLSLASFLYNRKQTFADHYCEQIDNHKIKHKYFKRYDRRLYDESLTGIKRQEAKVKGIKKRDQIMEFFRNLAVQYSTGKSSEKICNEMNSKIAKGDKALPQLKRLSLIGEGSLLEGTFFEFNNFWFVIRASGTDAVLRYYLDGENREEIESYQKSLVNMLI